MHQKDSMTVGRLTRRTVLKAACTVGATIVAGPALAQQTTQQTPYVKGPRVWLDMDQKEIDDAYDQSVWAPNQAHISKRRAIWSEADTRPPQSRTSCLWSDGSREARHLQDQARQRSDPDLLARRRVAERFGQTTPPIQPRCS